MVPVASISSSSRMTGSRKPLPDADLFAAVLRDVKPLRRTKVSPHPDPVPARESKAAAPAKPLPRAETRPSTPVTPPPPPNAGLDRFVRQAWRDGLRVLLIITGKGSVRDGGGVLRRNLPRWLASGEHGPRVLRIESAQPRHGGSGAYYVLLRRQRDGRAS